jgi:hypothetical protein
VNEYREDELVLLACESEKLPLGVTATLVTAELPLVPEAKYGAVPPEIVSDQSDTLPGPPDTTLINVKVVDACD